MDNNSNYKPCSLFYVYYTDLSLFYYSWYFAEVIKYNTPESDLDRSIQITCAIENMMENYDYGCPAIF